MNLATFKNKYQNLDNVEIDDIDVDESTSSKNKNKDSSVIYMKTINYLHDDTNRHHSILINDSNNNNEINKNDVINDGHDGNSRGSNSGSDDDNAKTKSLYLITTTTTSIIINIILMIIIISISIQFNYLHEHHNQCTEQPSFPSSSSPSSPFKSFEVKSKINHGVIATDTMNCSEIGKDILLQGGNSIDAAIAATLCLGILSPISSGLGGGCFILIHNHSTNTNIFIDSREVAPLSTYSDIFINQSMKAQNGGLAIAVLSELKGLYYIYENYSNKKIKWKDLVLPSAKLAESWIISSELAYTMNKEVSNELKSGEFPLLSELYVNKDTGEIKQKGDEVKQPILANTLRMIAEYGSSYIYDTMINDIVNDINEAGGNMSYDDIRNYSIISYPAIETQIFGFTYLSVSGSSSGGPVVAGILKFMSSYMEPIVIQSYLYYHRLIEAMKHTFAIRLFLGDPLFVNITGPTNALLNDEYMRNLQIYYTNDSYVQSSINQYGGSEYNIDQSSSSSLPIDHGTTHLSVIDSEGNAVSLTSTINTYFGSKVISKSTGILFNNEMDDFSIPGVPNYFGLLPSSRNFPEPKKRPLSSMSPFILLDRNNNVRLIGGSSGGPRIITATVQVLLNVIGKGMDLLSALTSPRVHTQLIPDMVDIENHTLYQLDYQLYDDHNQQQQQQQDEHVKIIADEKIFYALESRGHKIQSYDGSMGCSQFIDVNWDDGVITAVSDPRKDGRPAATEEIKNN